MPGSAPPDPDARQQDTATTAGGNGASAEDSSTLDTESTVSSTASIIPSPSTQQLDTDSTTTIVNQKIQTPRLASSSNSPAASRETSPIRPQPRFNRPSVSVGRPRKNSTQDPSPTRSTTSSNPASATVPQRVFSAAAVPRIPPTSTPTALPSPTPQRAPAVSDLKEVPRWPISPRLRSPPPLLNKPSVASPRKMELEIQNMAARRTSPPAQQSDSKRFVESELDDVQVQANGIRTPARGVSGASSTLETVQEMMSQPNTPGSGLDGILEKNEEGYGRGTNESENPMDQAFGRVNAKTKPNNNNNESGSDGGGGKTENKMRHATGPAASSQRPSGVAAVGGKAGQGVRAKSTGEGSTKNMTVETETVSSVPQITLGGPGAGHAGSIRAKPSTETIRPKKDKKKTTRKVPSASSGAVSSKADIFEAQVASAVDEANSSDSEETFVYESNPPEVSERPRRFHSRTPSATSMVSQFEQRNPLRNSNEGGHSVAMKKSMKFVNTHNGDRPEQVTGEDDGKGTVRSSMGTGRGTTHHHHIPRWGRNGGNGHASLFDNESPFPQVAKTKNASNGTVSRHSSQPSSPRASNAHRTAGGGGRKYSRLASGYDLDDGADDERTPLVNHSRSPRMGRNRRFPEYTFRQMDRRQKEESRTSVSRFSHCLALMIMFFLFALGGVGFVVATTQPLVDVKLVAVKSVLASEQDIIFDVIVQARNPNIMTITIDAVDLVIFAKSIFAGTDEEYWRRPQEMKFGSRGSKWLINPFDPLPDDGPTSSPNLEIGHIYELESPLTFDGSPFKRTTFISVGQVRVDHPGNRTTPAGSERWGKIIQHEFDLLVRGTLKYTLPLSQTVRRLSVDGRATVKPNAAERNINLVI